MSEQATASGGIEWVASGDYTDILYATAEGIAKITINRPEVHNAFRPETIMEISHAIEAARQDSTVGVIILTGAGGKAFCSGGDQRVRGDAGYESDEGQVGRFHVTDLQVQMRRCPKPIVAMVAGWAIGGGHVLQVLADVSIAADTARFGQAGPRVGSFDAGFGSAYLARVVGEKKAREIWFFCRQYTADQALDMGLVNAVVPAADLLTEAKSWVDEVAALSPTAIKFLKQSFNADTDHQLGLSNMAMTALDMFGVSAEGMEGATAFAEKRTPDFGPHVAWH